MDAGRSVTPPILWGRLAWVVGVLAILGGGAVWLRQVGPTGMPYDCMFHEMTGLHCPGCGMTRASHALLEGRVLDAIRFNPVGMVLMPLACLGLLVEAVFWIKGVPPTWKVPVGKKGGIAIAAVVIAFSILRNLPWWPFTLLAPV